MTTRPRMGGQQGLITRNPESSSMAYSPVLGAYPSARSGSRARAQDRRSASAPLLSMAAGITRGQIIDLEPVKRKVVTEGPMLMQKPRGSDRNRTCGRAAVLDGWHPPETTAHATRSRPARGLANNQTGPSEQGARGVPGRRSDLSTHAQKAQAKDTRAAALIDRGAPSTLNGQEKPA